MFKARGTARCSNFDNSGSGNRKHFKLTTLRWGTARVEDLHLHPAKGRCLMSKIRKSKLQEPSAKLKSPKQLIFFPKQKIKREHGGSLAVRKRRSRRPLNLRLSHHITMKSHHGIGKRSLFRHKKMILGLMKKNAFRFQVKVVEYAIQGNHIHMLVRAHSREGLQNFFRVVAGHTAQKILQKFPLPVTVGGAPIGREECGLIGCAKNRRKFWSFLLYSRVVSWGRDYSAVVSYIQRNTLELLRIIAYQPRKKPKSGVKLLVRAGKELNIAKLSGSKS